MSSSWDIAQISFHKRIQVGPNHDKDYVHSSLVELFQPSFHKLENLDTPARIAVAKQFLNPHLFSGIQNDALIQFVAESNIPLSAFEAIFRSININIDNQDHQSAFDIVKKMTGHEIKAQVQEIMQIMIQTFQSEKIKSLINFQKLGGQPNIKQTQELNYIKGEKLSSYSEGILLRACIYFIKEQYPNKNFSEINKLFHKHNSSSLYKEIKEYFQENKALYQYLNQRIKDFLQHKYALTTDKTD
ncbi:MAG: hypothetical protein GXP45_05870 [bacterium]|nr:hypothetical protein [bacterium]